VLAQAANTIVATGGAGAVASAALTQAGNTVNATGKVAVAGQAALAQAGNTLAATGELLELGGIVAALNVVQESNSLTAIAVVAWVAILGTVRGPGSAGTVAGMGGTGAVRGGQRIWCSQRGIGLQCNAFCGTIAL
jgi:hypothetical protein